MPVAEIGGYKAGYLDKGAGDLIMFAHCSLGYSGFWKGVIAELSDSWRCISIDLPGHAQSDRGDPDISLQHQAIEYVLGLADVAGAERFHTVGLSLGGAIMTRLAHHHPARVRSLAAFEPILFHFLHNWARKRLRMTVRSWARCVRPPMKVARMRLRVCSWKAGVNPASMTRCQRPDRTPSPPP